MEMLRYFWDSVVALDPRRPTALDEGRSSILVCASHNRADDARVLQPEAPGIVFTTFKLAEALEDRISTVLPTIHADYWSPLPVSGAAGQIACSIADLPSTWAATGSASRPVWLDYRRIFALASRSHITRQDWFAPVLRCSRDGLSRAMNVASRPRHRAAS